MPERTEVEANAQRFSGFASLYDEVRPTPGPEVVDLLRRYLGRDRPDVVDLGSGTGLSSRWAATWAASVVGVEPSADMRERAGSATREPNVRFTSGWSHTTGLEAASADLVIAVQALHWMDPEPTFAEVARILRPGGIFAAMDCDWPPSIGDIGAERAWQSCRGTVKVYESRLARGLSGRDLAAPLDPSEDAALPAHFFRDPNKDRVMAVGVRSWSKDEHLSRMGASGRFEWCHEFVLHHRETGDAARFIDLLRSQGDFQTLLKHGMTEEQLGVTAFAAEVRARLGEARRPFWFSWRVRMGVTGWT